MSFTISNVSQTFDPSTASRHAVITVTYTLTEKAGIVYRVKRIFLKKIKNNEIYCEMPLNKLMNKIQYCENVDHELEESKPALYK